LIFLFQLTSVLTIRRAEEKKRTALFLYGRHANEQINDQKLKVED
jgi:hypothetical protein